MESHFKSLKVFLLLIFSVAVFCTKVNGRELEDVSFSQMEVLKWEKKAPGVWSAQLGKADKMTYLDFAEEPKIDALARIGDIDFPLDKEFARGLVSNGRAIVSIPLKPEERLYGLGLQFEGMNRRGGVYHLRVDHYSSGKDRTHAPVPFYVSSDGYGVFFNSARFISIYAGVGNRADSANLPPIRDRNTDRQWQAQPTSDAVEASVVDDSMEVFVFAGPSMLDVVRRYNLYCGGGCLPPKWGLGFWHRMRTHATDKEVLQEVEEFDKRDFPLDVIGLEPGWQSKSYPCTFEWDKGRFAEPEAFVREMKTKGIFINLWENPYVSPDAGIYEKIKPYCGSHTVWLGIVPDYTLKEARDILIEQHEKEHIDIGVSGYKIDEVDGYDFWLWPDHAIFPSGKSAEQMRQTYGLQLQKMLMDTYRKRNLRTYCQVRASNAGASSFPFAIYTDHYDHRGFIGALVNCGFSGVLYTPEIRSAGSSEEWVRRMQSVCFSPLMQLNGWASNTKPWTFPDVEDKVREVIKLRMSLLPYIYSSFAKYHFEGTPLIRAMVLEEGYSDRQRVTEGKLDDTKNPYAMAVRKDVTDQFMFGESILVAPMFTGQKERKVILPTGKWYDFYTGDYIGEKEVITVSPSLESIPLFVKDGGIVPIIDPVNRITKMEGDIELEVRHYGKMAGEFELYDDDGRTYDYEKGKYCLIKLSVNSNDKGELEGSMSKIHSGWECCYKPIKWRFMSERK